MATKADKNKLRKERLELKAEEREAKLKAFKAIDNVGEAIAFVFVYSKTAILVFLAFILGYVFRHYELFLAIFKKLGIVEKVVK